MSFVTHFLPVSGINMDLGLFQGDSTITQFNSKLTHVYLMEETGIGVELNDSYGSLHTNNARVGQFVTSVLGKRNNGLQSTAASNSGLRFPSQLINVTRNYAISFWFKHDGTYPYGEFLAQYAAPTTYRVIAFMCDPSISTIYYNLGNTVGGSANIQTAGITSGVWRHCLLTLDSNTIELFIDAVSIGTATFSGTHPTTSTTWMWDRISAGNSFLRSFHADELYIWNETGLTFSSPTKLQLAQALYNSGAGKYYL